MTQMMMKSALLVCGLTLASAAGAAAQGPPPARMGFFNVNGGYQPQSRDFTEGATFPIYRETGSFETGHAIDNGGVIDVAGGVRVWHNLALGAGLAIFRETEDVTVNATIPSPLFFDRPASSSTQATGLRHRERAVHLQALWFMPITNEFDVAFSLGPSFFHVTQDIVSDISVRQLGQDVTGVSILRQAENTVGFNIGIDGTYLVNRWLGGGMFMRYAKGSVDLPVAGGDELSLDVGGFQVGVGLRIRF